MAKASKPASGKRPGTKGGAGKAAVRKRAAKKPAKQSAPRSARESAAEANLERAPRSAEEPTAATPPAGSSEATMPAPAAAPVRDAARGPSAASILWTVVLLAVFAGTVYATAPLWSVHVAGLLPAAVKELFGDSRVLVFDARIKSLETVAEARQNMDRGMGDLEAARARVSDELKILIDRVEGLEQSLTAVRKLIEVTAAATESAEAEKSLRQLSERLARLEDAGAGAAGLAANEQVLAAAVAEVINVTGRVGAVAGAEKAKSSIAGAGAAVLVAVARLREDLRTSAPFSASLRAVEAVAADDPDMGKAIDVLKPHAAGGIPSFGTLRTGFDEIAAAIVRAAGRLEGEGWVGRTVNRLGALITVRRTGDNATVGGDAAVDAIVARTETKLDAGDLNGAVEALGGLEGAAAAAAAPWIDDARIRLAAERALATLHVHAISLLEPVKG